MRNVNHYETEVVRVPPHATACEIARKMEMYGVGSVIVVDDAGGALGIVTDRDLLLRVVAPGRDGDKATASQLMHGALVTGSPDDPLEEVLQRMRSACVRRLPVLRDGKLSGLVTIDDVVAGLASELWDLREAQRDKVLAARRRGRRRHRREELEGSLEELRGALAHVGSHAKEWLGSEIEMLRKRLGGGDD